ncbi:hypothetical protein ACLOAV_000160 [Pseudogymnoascus australis]
MSRASAFWFPSTDEAVAFATLLPELEGLFRKDSESTSNHIRLQRLTPHIVGSTVHYVCDKFMKSPKAREMQLQKVTIDSQMSSDKKLSWGNIMRTRGMRVLVWGSISDAVSRSVLGCSTEEIHQVILNSKEGAAMNGQLGYSINPSNVIAAMFIACGQDVASVAEASWSQLSAEYDRDTKTLRLTSYFPSLPVGTVSGGTSYPTQKECLEMPTCTGPGAKQRLAGLIASFSLALDISTVAAIANGTFSKSHERLARTGGKTARAML